jgi:hypothetical protein
MKKKYTENLEYCHQRNVMYDQYKGKIFRNKLYKSKDLMRDCSTAKLQEDLYKGLRDKIYNITVVQ